MKRKYFLQLIILFFSLLLPAWGFAAEKISSAEAESWANHKGEEILNILADKNLAQKYEKLDKILYQDIDLDNAARFAVGKYWKTMTKEQQNRYVPLFKKYIASLYKGYPLDLGKGSIGFKVSKVLQNKSGVDVFCDIQLKQQQKDSKNKEAASFKVLFVLVKNNGHIQVRDLKIGESSLLLAFRSRFYHIIYDENDEEIDWFLDDLQTITDDNEQKNAEKLENAAF